MALVARATGVVPLVGGVLAAAALAGAAVLTVQQAGCATPSHFVRAGDQVQLVGGCVGGTPAPGGWVQAAGDGTAGSNRDQTRP